jgi:hypothetical protein
MKLGGFGVIEIVGVDVDRFVQRSSDSSLTQKGIAPNEAYAYFFCRWGWARRMTAMTSHRVGRRILSCVLAYALALQGFIFAATIDGPAISAANAAAWTGFQLCTHDGGSAALPGAPSQAPAGDGHCIFCLGGAVYVDGARPSAPHYSKVGLTNVAWPRAAPRLVAFFVNESAWPRGPPAAV